MVDPSEGSIRSPLCRRHEATACHGDEHSSLHHRRPTSHQILRSGVRLHPKTKRRVVYYVGGDLRLVPQQWGITVLTWRAGGSLEVVDRIRHIVLPAETSD